MEKQLKQLASRIEASDSATLTAHQIEEAFKALLLDFVSGRTSRQSASEVSKILHGAVFSKRLARIEELNTSSQLVPINY